MYKLLPPLPLPLLPVKPKKLRLRRPKVSRAKHDSLKATLEDSTKLRRALRTFHKFKDYVKSKEPKCTKSDLEEYQSSVHQLK